MPTVLRVDGFRFHFWSNEGHEPAHIHAARAGCEAKFWLNPVSLASSRGYRPVDLTRLLAMVRENEALLLAAWKAFLAEKEKEKKA